MTNFIPYGRQDITDDDIAAVVQTLRSDFLTQGPAVEEFESTFGAYLGAKNVVAVSNGTAGLHIAYLAAGVGKGDAVIVPAITFAATANAVLYCGGTPVFADIDSFSGGISIDSAERAISLAKSKGLRPKVIAPVHFAGRPCDLGAIFQLALKHNLMVIEDACHAFGAEFRLNSSKPFQKIGSSDVTSMAVFSFHPVKHVTTGEGGAVTTSDPKLAKKLYMLRSHGITKDSSAYLNKDRSQNGLNSWYHEMQLLGLNYRLCDIQAALGSSQVKRAEANIKRRRDIASIYSAELSGIKYLTLPTLDSDVCRHSFHLYPIRIDFKSLGSDRSTFMNKLKELGVGSQVHYIPVNWHPYYEANKDLWFADETPEAAKFYESELSIPMYHSLTGAEQTRVIAALRHLLT